MPRNGREFGNCRLRQFGETVGALCATGVSYPPYSARRAPDVPPEGRGRRGRFRLRTRSAARPRRQQECLGTLCAHQLGTAHVPMTTRVRFIPLIPSRRTLASARAIGRLVATGFRSRATKHPACPESHTSGIGTGDRYRSTSRETPRQETRERGRVLGKRNLSDRSGFAAQHDLDYRGLVT